MAGALGPLDRSLERLYRGRFSDPERRAKARLWGVLHDHFFARYIGAGDTVLDLGAGYCDFVNHVRARRRVAVDLNPETARSAAPGVEVVEAPFERVGDVVAAGSVDLVFASNVLEHVRGPDALLGILAGVWSVLRPGGRLVVVQPNIRAVGAAFWDYVDHTLPLTERGMAEALRLAGFEVEECRARFLPYTVKSRLPKWPWIVRLYLVLRPAQWVFGRQMLVVARRPR
jgi:SAM-dependent methyltransferase